jgi:hypothetical protein
MEINYWCRDAQVFCNHIEMFLAQMPKLEYYWSNSQLYGSNIIRSAMFREGEGVRIATMTRFVQTKGLIKNGQEFQFLSWEIMVRSK